MHLRRYNYDVASKHAGTAIFPFARAYGLHEMQRREADEEFNDKILQLQQRINRGELTLTEDEVEDLEGSRSLQEQILTALSDGSVGRICIWDRVPWLRSFSAVQVRLSES